MRPGKPATLFLLALVSACAAGEVTDGGDPGSHATPTAPRGAYVPIRTSRRVSKTTYQPGDGLTIFVNPAGGTYHAGVDDPASGTSSVVASSGRGQVTIPAYGGRTDWDALVKCVAGELDGLNVTVSDVRPSTGAYVEVVMGGDGSELGLKGYAGVAPIDTTDCLPIDRAVVFVFASKLEDLRGSCEATVAEIGHVATLDHTFDCSDPMSYLAGCGERHFQDTDMACGELSERPCVCGRATQNSAAILRAQLGSAPEGELPPPGDCGTVDYAGTCTGDVLTWCAHGDQKRTLDCGAASLTCGPAADVSLGNDCVPAPDAPDACMGIDFLGQCSDSGVLTYCLDGALQTIDCAALGQSCTYVDDSVGFYCTNPPAPDNCMGVDFFGQCSDAGVLSYCLDGQLRTIDCTAASLRCGLIDDVTGFGCI
jgi:hypothetical protein